MHIFYTPDISLTNELPKEEVQHCVRVLRLKEGDKILLVDGKGCFYKATICLISGKRCLIDIDQRIQQEAFRSSRLHIALAPTKNIDRTEWFVEKATEIGIDEISFLNCRFSERKVIKTERIEKILISAMKQSMRAVLPDLNDMMDFSKFLARDFKGQKFIAHCYQGNKHLLKDIIHAGEDVTLLIGPEGDFSLEEVEQAVKCGFVPISLGKARLRTETAALVACHTMNLINQ